MRKLKNTYVTILSVLVLFLAWEGAALLAGSLSGTALSGTAPAAGRFPTPWETLKAVAAILADVSFLKAVGWTLIRGLAGFMIALLLGIGLGIAGGLSSSFHAFMKPWVVVVRATPVVAFVLIAAVFFSPGAVPVLIGILAMFPIVYLNIAEGVRSVDTKLLQMARLYGVRGFSLVRKIYVPAIRPFSFSGISTACGFGWKAIVACEVITHPQWGIGAMMRTAQLEQKVDVLIAWTLVAVALSAVFELILNHGYRSGSHK